MRKKLQRKGWKLILTNHDTFGGDRSGSCWDAELSDGNENISFQVDIDACAAYDGLRWCRTLATDAAWERLIERKGEAR